MRATTCGRQRLQSPDRNRSSRRSHQPPRSIGTNRVIATGGFHSPPTFNSKECIMPNSSPVNPFYIPVNSPASGFRQPVLATAVYAKLPAAPRTASPVPHLTSLYHFSRAGEYGNRNYPGNRSEERRVGKE